MAFRCQGSEPYLYYVLNQQNQNLGISLDSWWMPEKVERKNLVLELALSGSPSGTKEQDIIPWLTLKSASKVNGEMSIGDADTETWKIGDLVEADYEDDEDVDIEYHDGAGHSLLHLSAEMGNAKRVRLLIDKGADIEARNKAGGTPILWLLMKI